MTDSLRRSTQVDVLIRGWGNTNLTRNLLMSIQRNTPAPSYNIVYVDNGSDVREAAALMMDFPDVTHVRLPFNHGSVRAINNGMALSSLSDAPYILLLDNDAEVPAGDTGWLERLVGYFTDEKVGVVGCVTDYVSGHQNCEALPDFYAKDWQDGDRRGFKEQPDWPVLVSFAMAIRKRAMKELGWFWDERFEPGNHEDYDTVLRLREKGWKAKIANSVWIHHRGSQTFRRLDFSNLLKTNEAKLVEKWGTEKLSRMGLRVRATKTT